MKDFVGSVRGFVIILVIISFFIGFVSLLVVGENRRSENDAACKLKGGIPFHSRDSGFICLRPEALIDP